MNSTVKSRLESVQLGDPQTYKNIAILPLIAPADGGFQYRTLGEALATWDIAITEVSAGGSVPELMVINRGNQCVLLIDGEEVAGAKQNRVLNTSILLKEVSETRIPVSCTEQGRWAYSSKAFSESGHVMAHKTRARKTRSVHESLVSCGTPMSDQGEVWNGIAELQAQACAQSPTSAMSDVFRAREDDLRQCDEIFRAVPNQVGFLAIINGRPAGLDLVSLTSAYAKLHTKLVRSYTLEGLVTPSPSPRREERQGPSRQSAGATADEVAPPQPSDLGLQPSALAESFLAEIFAAEERHFPSIGHGTDFRYRSVAPRSTLHAPHSLAGTALVHENELIHAAFFRLDEPRHPAFMDYLLRRRSYRPRP